MSRGSSVRSIASHSPPSLETVQIKLSRVVSRHEHLKVAYHQLHSQIMIGLHEAEDVIASLAIPLMKLVGLKTFEMAAEGRFSTIVTSVDHSHSQEDSNYMNRAVAASSELMERQKLRLVQLITLLKKIEAQVNSNQNSIIQNLANHQAFMKKFFMKSFRYVSEVHQSGQSNDLSHIMLKILKATYDQVAVALRSVEVGVDDLMCELAEKMCNPMVEYVNDLKAEMKTGISMHLLEVVKEMDKAMEMRQFELEEARKQAWLAEQSRTEALSKLQNSEETTKKLTMSLALLIEDGPESQGNPTQQEPPSAKEDLMMKDDSLLWDLLRKKRKCLQQNSSLGTMELSVVETRNNKLRLPRSTSRSNTKSPFIDSGKLFCPSPPAKTRKVNTESPFINSGKLLCSSPSASIQKVLSRKRVTP